MLDNCPEFLMAWLGLARLGIMEVPINTGLRGNLLTYILNQSECKAIFIASEWIDRILEIESELKYLETVNVQGEKQNDISLSRLDIYMFKSLMNTADFKKSK